MSSENAEKGEKEKKLGDFFKKIVNTGLGAAFVTEDILKGIVSDIPVPKDIVHQLVQNAKNTKEELYKSAEKAFRDYLQGIDLKSELENILDQYELDIHISFKRKNKKRHDSPGK